MKMPISAVVLDLTAQSVELNYLYLGSVFTIHPLTNVLLLLLFGLAAGEILEAGCSRPDAPENGEMFILWSGLLVQFRCNSGFKLEGAPAIICRSGQWTQDSPVCLSQGKQLCSLVSVRVVASVRACVCR